MDEFPGPIVVAPFYEDIIQLSQCHQLVGEIKNTPIHMNCMQGCWPEHLVLGVTTGKVPCGNTLVMHIGQSDPLSPFHRFLYDQGIIALRLLFEFFGTFHEMERVPCGLWACNVDWEAEVL